MILRLDLLAFTLHSESKVVMVHTNILAANLSNWIVQQALCIISFYRPIGTLRMLVLITLCWKEWKTKFIPKQNHVLKDKYRLPRPPQSHRQLKKVSCLPVV